MSDVITVINRTATNVMAGAAPQFGIGGSQVYIGSGPQIPPGGSSKISFVSGTGGPYQVGFISVVSGTVTPNYYYAAMSYDVFANSLVTLVLEVGTRGDADADSTADAEESE